ncbi:MAG: ABC transporter ATP-binding protein [Planctomycetota bacterium]
MAGKDETVIRLVELSKIYKDFWGRQRVKALDNVNLEVKQGEVFGLLGPNGSGKTTTVRLMLGLLFPTRGAVSIFGKTPRNVDVKKRIGYMPEESNLYGYLNAEETLDFFGRLFRLDPAVRKERIDSLIEMVGLEPARKRPVGEFSKGMARRMGLAQALINDPDLLILDEPTTGLDPIGAREIKDLIVTLKERGKTIFLCSHLLGDVEAVCDRICVLYGGKIRTLGEVEDLLKEEEMTEIRAPRLPDETIEQIRNTIKNARGDDTRVDIGSPSRRLEEFFVDVVRQARKERMATAGAESGKETAQFLQRSKEEAREGEELVEELVSGGKESEEAAEEEPEAEPAEAPGARDEGMIDELVGGEEEETGEEEEVEPAEADEQKVRRDLLKDLEEEDDEEEENR